MTVYATIDEAKQAAKAEQETRDIVNDWRYWSVVIIVPEGYAVYRARAFDTSLGTSLEPWHTGEVVVYAVISTDSGYLSFVPEPTHRVTTTLRE